MAQPVDSDHPGSRGQAILAITCACLFTGLAAGILTGIKANVIVVATITTLTMAVLSIAITFRQEKSLGKTAQNLKRAAKDFRPRRIFYAICLDTVGFAAYYLALQNGPVGPIVAIVLTYPIILVLMRVIRKKQRLSVKTITSLLLMALALILMALSRSEESRHSHVVIALCFALVSATAAAGSLSLYAGVARDTQTYAGIAIVTAPMTILGVLVLVVACVLTPAWIDLHISSTHIVFLVVFGTIALVAAKLYWFALRKLPDISVGKFGPFEIVAATITTRLLYDTPMNLKYQLPIVVLLIAAIYLDLDELKAPQRSPNPREVAP